MDNFSKIFNSPNLKKPLVSDVFAKSAKKYDFMNDAMSLGLHRLWKINFVNSMVINDGDKILDVSSGSGDIALLILQKAKKNNIKVHITISDYSDNMLSLAKNRTEFAEFQNSISFLKINACGMFKKSEDGFDIISENDFDIVTCSFGVRNFYNINLGLEQIFKSLKQNGAFYCLEFSPPQNGLFKNLYNFYSKGLVPKFANLIGVDGDCYKYLSQSINSFLTPEQFLNQILDSGFKSCFYSNIFKNLVTMHCGFKKE
jgi:demethylmenaquinone methyltransferase/2-methoxy-6-polyprenyl-1,4-benzoquinol methylase